MTTRKQLYLLLAIVIAPASAFLAITRFSSDPSCDLPAHFEEQTEQLRYLALPGSCADLEWLPGSLSELHLPYASPKSLSLPRHLKILDLNRAQLPGAVGLPAGLESLDARGSLPDSLTLNDDLQTYRGNRRLSSWPSNLRHLTLSEVNEAPKEWPKSLESLKLERSTFPVLEGLPPKLRALTIEGTALEQIRELPEAMERLTVRHNGQLRTPWKIPDFVLKLAIDQPFSVSISNLKYIERLEIDDANPSSWPPSLRALSISGHQGVFSGSRLPRDLRELTLRDGEALELSDLPENLESLNLSTSKLRSLGGLPGHLKRLELAMCKLDDVRVLDKLAELSDLEYLDLSIPELDNLPVLPQNLRVLRARWINVEHLRLMPSGLQELDLSGAPKLTDVSLYPANLRLLSLSKTAISNKALSVYSASGEILRSRLPDSLRVLDISRTAVSEIALPLKVSDLNVGWTNIHDLASLHHFGQSLAKVGWHSLTLSRGQIPNFARLPRSVTKLTILDKYN